MIDIKFLRENAEKRRATSIGNDKKTSHKNTKKNATQKALPWILVATLILGAAGIKFVPKLKENIEYTNDLKAATEIVTEVATENLEGAGLVNVDKNGLVTINQGNTIEDYSRLGLVDASLGEYYAYGSALNEAVKNAKDDRLGASHDEYEKLINSFKSTSDNGEEISKENPKEETDATFTMAAIGDVMCHNTQYWDAYNKETDTYEYSLPEVSVNNRDNLDLVYNKANEYKSTVEKEFYNMIKSLVK